MATKKNEYRKMTGKGTRGRLSRWDRNGKQVAAGRGRNPRGARKYELFNTQRHGKARNFKHEKLPQGSNGTADR